MNDDENINKEQTSGIPPIAWILAALVLVAVAGFFFATRHAKPISSPADATTQAPLDPYAAQLPIAGIVMSEAGSLAGGKLTYIDGHIRNTGAKTVAAITAQTVFRNDVGELPQLATQPLMLIRTHEPYVDLETVAAAPIKPGDDREFRLIFESVTPNWNQQYPEVHVIHVDAR